MLDHRPNLPVMLSNKINQKKRYLFNIFGFEVEDNSGLTLVLILNFATQTNVS